MNRTFTHYTEQPGEYLTFFSKKIQAAGLGEHYRPKPALAQLFA